MVVEENDATATVTAQKVDENSKDDNNCGPSSILSKLLLSSNKLSTTTTKTNETTDRKSYEDRLLSFNPLTYYAKPACLSPIICAGLGWRNVDDEKDLLSCSICNQAIMITINHKLSAKSIENLCHKYRQQLATTHDINSCPFYLSKQQFDKLDNNIDNDDVDGNNNNTTDDVLLKTTTENNESSSSKSPPPPLPRVLVVVPPYIANKIPENCLKLMEHPKPSFLLKNRIQDFQNAFVTSSNNNKYNNSDISTKQQQQQQQQWHILENALQFPSELIRYQTQLQQQQILNGESVFSNISNFLGTKDVSIAMLALLGWVPIPQDVDDDNDETTIGKEASQSSISVGCPLCFSIMELPLENQTEDKQGDGGGEEGKEEPPTKRLKKGRTVLNNPLDLHRYYCPMVCGFPRNVSDNDIPVWKLLLQRINKEMIDDGEEEQDEAKIAAATEDGKQQVVDYGDLEFERIRKLLRLGIVPKKVVLEE